MTHEEAYSERRAVFLAQCAALVMRDRVIVERQLMDVNFRLTHWFQHEVTGTVAAMLDLADCYVLAFRATEVDIARPLESLKDIRTDLMFRKVAFRGAKVHRGFLAAYFSVRMEIVEAVRTIDRTKPLFVTGHSLGGALAKLAGMELDADRLGAIYTFGAPRVGDKGVEPAIGAPLYQFIHAADIVPRVPLLSLGYRGSGDRRFINRKGEIRRGTGLHSMGSFASVLLCPWRWPLLVKDHGLEDCYIPPIEAQARRQAAN